MGDKPKFLFVVGWVCPICGRALSPLVAECPCGGYQDEDDEENELLDISCTNMDMWVDKWGCLYGGHSDNTNTVG